MAAPNSRKKARNERKRKRPSYMAFEKRKERRIKRAAKRTTYLKRRAPKTAAIKQAKRTAKLISKGKLQADGSPIVKAEANAEQVQAVPAPTDTPQV